MSKGHHSIKFSHQEDPESGEQYMDLHVQCRLGLGVAILERMMAKIIIPSAEQFDPEGLELNRRINGEAP